MSKRKRLDLIEGDSNVTDRCAKVAKRAKSAQDIWDRRLPLDRPSTSSQRQNATIQRPHLSTSDPSLHSQPPDIDEPPPGLTAGQRKRWRKRQRKKVRDRASTQLRRTSPLVGHHPHARSLVSERVSRTSLIARPVKRWITSGESPRRSPHIETAVEALRKDFVATDNQTTSLRPKVIGNLVPTPKPSSPGNSGLPHPCSRDAAISSVPLAKQKLQKPHSQSLRDILTPFNTNAGGPTFGAVVSRRATTVPSVARQTDGRSAFKRFSAFVAGRKDDSSSDDDSGESESDNDRSSPSDEDDELPLPSNSVQDTAGFVADFAVGKRHRPAATMLRGEEDDHSDAEDHAELELAETNNIQSPVQQRAYSESPPVRFTPINATPQKNDAGAGSVKLLVPAIAEWIAQPDLTSATSHDLERTTTRQPEPPEPSRRANVGIKRQTAVTDAGQGVPSPALSVGQAILNTKKPSSAFDHLDDEDDNIFKAIDEVTKDVFESTRPLPQSKPRQPAEDLTDHDLTTFASSDHGLKGMKTRIRVFKEVLLPRSVVEPSVDVVVCLSVRVDDDVHDNVEVAGRQQVGLTVDEPSQPSASTVMQGHGAVLRRSRSKSDSSSSLSELSRTPSPPRELLVAKEERHSLPQDPESEIAAPLPTEKAVAAKKRKMTGRTSKHFTPEKKPKRTKPTPSQHVDDSDDRLANQIVISPNATNEPHLRSDSPIADRTRQSEKKTRTKTKRKSTPKKSPHFLPLHLLDRVDLPSPLQKRGRVPAGTSTAPVPPITSERFGIIQEKLWKEPFWLLVAVTFLNKTAGRAAAPTFWALKEKYPTPELLAEADQSDLHDLIHHLGLQTQRSKRLILISKAWCEQPPVAGRRWRTLHYPAKGDGKGFKKADVVEEDAQDCAGALEIGAIPGCGPYAWDSWRIFCRDVLRGVAEDYNGKGAVAGTEGEGEEEEAVPFEPEWKRVLPLDKELRATLRWMWLREGWIWDHETGERRRASEEEMERARLGEMEVPDAGERKFAERAVGLEGEGKAAVVDDGAVVGVESALLETSNIAPLEKSGAGSETPEQSGVDEIGHDFVVPPSRRREVRRRSSRVAASQ